MLSQYDSIIFKSIVISKLRCKRLKQAGIIQDFAAISVSVFKGCNGKQPKTRKGQGRRADFGKAEAKLLQQYEVEWNTKVKQNLTSDCDT